MSTNPNERQVGGSHYGPGRSDQHWDMLAECGYGWEYYKGRATAYLTRVKKPEEDTEKAGHFIEKLIWLIDTRAVPRIFKPTQAPKQAILTYLRERYFPANRIDPAGLAAEAIEIIMLAQTREDLQRAIEVCAKIEHDRLLKQHAPNGSGWPFPNTPPQQANTEPRKGRWDDAVAAAQILDGQITEAKVGQPDERVFVVDSNGGQDGSGI